MKYDALSDKEFLLKLSIQANYNYNVHLFLDQDFDIPGDNKWHTYEREFTGDPSVKGLIMYKVGLAPKDTVFQVRNIRIELMGKITK
ncbi:hypothetical protein [Candidatus Magnetominusculus dajiuhuensis]|uniref:hypothetical protein n=1 Tax=Candidatus Magnetominusculus dajiuhuensis TaxID=3137712 RepID=UPI003B42A1A6